jgi:hypothetical protein
MAVFRLTDLSLLRAAASHATAREYPSNGAIAFRLRDGRLGSGEGVGGFNRYRAGGLG